MAGALAALPSLPLGPAPEKQVVKATGTHGSDAAAIVRPIVLPTGNRGPKLSSAGNAGGVKTAGGFLGGGCVSAGLSSENGTPSVQDRVPLSERAKGFEPSTFSLEGDQVPAALWSTLP